MSKDEKEAVATIVAEDTIQKMLDSVKADLAASKAAVAESHKLVEKLTARVAQLEEKRQLLQAKIGIKDGCLREIQKYNNNPYMTPDLIRREINKQSDLALNEPEEKK